VVRRKPKSPPISIREKWRNTRRLEYRNRMTTKKPLEPSIRYEVWAERPDGRLRFVMAYDERMDALVAAKAESETEQRPVTVVFETKLITTFSAKVARIT
jgi:hypothetical protein